ncbi:hypothetical protein TVAGG3_0935390, partial [Trichomonas vaginalis G3]|uniref:hypothetical protein n=1 Tax=Trichomonas vaginalis (strain ATCC PRA-98 / G3) TaxID=412133 RepID=UPI0021E5DD68
MKSRRKTGQEKDSSTYPPKKILRRGTRRGAISSSDPSDDGSHQPRRNQLTQKDIKAFFNKQRKKKIVQTPIFQKIKNIPAFSDYYSASETHSSSDNPATSSSYYYEEDSYSDIPTRTQESIETMSDRDNSDDEAQKQQEIQLIQNSQILPQNKLVQPVSDDQLLKITKNLSDFESDLNSNQLSEESNLIPSEILDSSVNETKHVNNDQNIQEKINNIENISDQTKESKEINEYVSDSSYSSDSDEKEDNKKVGIKPMEIKQPVDPKIIQNPFEEYQEVILSAQISNEFEKNIPSPENEKKQSEYEYYYTYSSDVVEITPNIEEKQ